MRREFFLVSSVLCLLYALSFWFFPEFLWTLIVFVPIAIIGLVDALQTKHSILRNFPVLGHFRYWLEMVRPEINQYFVESNRDGRPFSREQRSLVYQRAKGQLDTVPFGTQDDVYRMGYEWLNHSINAKAYNGTDFRIEVGGKDCLQKYSSSILNISAMSYGSLSKTAIEALSAGARIGNFAHNTGEGGLSPYHLNGGGDLIWQIGTGYFGCRDENGRFSAALFEQKAKHPNVKMIEIKLSQGAKPGHGGILPAIKVTREISEIRHVPMGKDVISPPSHSSFDSPKGLLEFVQELRERSGGKPVGFKLCLGKRREFLSICRAMKETQIFPDYITVDGGEGGTGAAPLEFTNRVGTPLRDGLIFVQNCLVGFGIRNQLKLGVSGRVITGFDLAANLSLGADFCFSARGMMMALGCIQALRCNANVCPTGVATQKPELYKGLDVNSKKIRVAHYHKETIKSFGELLGAMGLDDPSKLNPKHLMRRVAHNSIQNYQEMYHFLKENELLSEQLPADFQEHMKASTSEHFADETA